MDLRPALLEIAPPRYERAPELLIAGLWGRYTMKSLAGIPAQWQRLVAILPGVPELDPGGFSYGVSWNCDDAGNFEYLCGVEVPGFAIVPATMQTIRIPPHEYAVFSHAGHISEIGRVLRTIFTTWIPEAALNAPRFPQFEKYGPSFNGATGEGGFELWIPVEQTPRPERAGGF